MEKEKYLCYKQLHRNLKAMIISILLIIIGYLIGVLWERYKYFKKTGKHLQDL